MADAQRTPATAAPAQTETAAAPAGDLPRLLAQPPAAPPTFGAHAELQSLAQAMEFASVIEKSGLAPKGLNREGIVIAIQMGAEVGLSIMQSVQNIASINGRPAIWGDAQLALVRASGLLVKYTAEQIGEPGTDSRGYRVTVHRLGQPKEASEEFTVADAKRAGMWGKQGPWTQYPQRMLMFRARGFLLRDQFGDVLKGLRSAEEVMDELTEHDTAPAPVAVPESRLKAPRKPATGPVVRGEGRHAEPIPASPAVDAHTIEDAPADLKPAAEPSPVPFTATAALAAVEAVMGNSDTARGMLRAYLVSTGALKPGQGLEHASQKCLAYMIETPQKAAAAVSKWADDQDARTKELRIMGEGKQQE
jgi:hypothetical protein